MGRFDTFTIIGKYTENKVRISIIISSIEFVNNINLWFYVYLPMIIKASCVALKFWFFHKIFIIVFYTVKWRIWIWQGWLWGGPCRRGIGWVQLSWWRQEQEVCSEDAINVYCWLSLAKPTKIRTPSVKI